MALSKDEKAQLEALNKKASEPDEPDHEVSIQLGDRVFTGPLSKARKVAKGWGFSLDDYEPEPDEDSEPDEDGKPADKPVRFGRRVG